MKKDFKYNENLGPVLDQLRKGAFLTVKSKDKLNTMTIGWGNIGIMWNKPVFMVMVRGSRYTFDLIKNSKDFTVSIPINVDMKKELSYCGTYSGRDVDKFKEANLIVDKSKSVDSPIIKNCDFHYECKILYNQQMETQTLDSKIMARQYPHYNLHTLFYGEIVESYQLD